jgi:AraC-like DNA-binding protein
MPFDIVVYTPAFIAIFWAIILVLSASRDQHYKRILSLFMFSAFALYLSHAIYFQNHRENFWIFDVLYILSSLSVYPLYFFYVRSLTQSERLKKSDFKAFLPAVVLAFFSLLLYLIMGNSLRVAYTNSFLYKSGDELNGSLVVAQSILYYISRTIYTFQIVFYFVKGLSLLKIYELRILNFYAYLEDKKLTWVTLLTYTFFIAAFLSVVFNILGKATFIYSIDYLYIPSFLFSVVLFFIGLHANLQNLCIVSTKRFEDEDDFHYPVVVSKTDDIFGERLDNLFLIQKMHLQPHLKITDVSKKLATNRTYISNYINNKKGITFSEYVNSLRIKEAKEILQQTNKGSIKQEELAEKSGFGCVRSFTRAFTLEVGMSPKNYRNEMVRQRIDNLNTA